MDCGRSPLPAGTRIKLEYGSLYRIIGDPIGFGSFSILYPAHRLIGEAGKEIPDGTLYALKECFPAAPHSFRRQDNGEVVPVKPDHREHLAHTQHSMLQESRVVAEIFETASHILPVLESAGHITVTLPGQLPHSCKNTVVVMHSLQNKGTPLRELMDTHNRLKPVYAFRILQQLLFALKEVHQAGFLHLDIKDSNIFLRGALEESDQILTLMDLGSARPLLKDGKTDHLVMQDLFVSNSNCPPEVSIQGREELASKGISVPDRLDMSADLYEAGCLLRYLLTGNPVRTRDLLYRQKGQYLSTIELTKLACPERTAQRVIRFLDKALDPDPEARYRSADEMLEHVSGILDKLSKKPTTLDAEQYDAFICYKHGPVDSVVARRLQRMLEHYRLPREKQNLRELFRRAFAEDHPPSGRNPAALWGKVRKIRKFFRLLQQAYFRRKPFHRVFVDEGELSSCADMGQELNRALKNSAHLIVLCSGDTPNSQWVNKEITSFRNSHKHDPNARILTVLTGGDEKTSYPAALFADGSKPEDRYSPKVQSRHPWKILYKLRQGEVLRLVAPMLGQDNLEDLLQRNKVYRRRRTALAAVCLSAAAAIFVSRSVLILRQAARIEEEHTAARRNASLYLTEQARNHLQNQDRPGALELLLEALPTREEKFPPAPQTEYQLAQALGAYVSPYRSEDVYRDTGKIQPAYASFFLDPTGEYLFSWNEASEAVDIWNTRTMEPHCTVNVPLATIEQYLQRQVDLTSLTFLLTPRQYACETDADFLLPDNRRLILRGRGRITALDYVSGSAGWTVPLESTVTMAINESRTRLVVLTEQETDPLALTAHILDTDTGRSLNRIAFSIAPGWTVSAGMQISEDLKWAAVPVQETNPESVYFPHQKLYLLDLETGDSRLLHLQEYRIGSMRFVGHRLLLQNYNNITFTMLEPNGVELSNVPDTRVSLESYDPATGTLLWHQELSCYTWDSYDLGILPVPYDTGTLSGQGILFYWERFAILTDQETGAVVRSYELPDGILRMRTQNNRWYAILCDGTEATGSYDSENLYRNKLVSEPLIGAAYQNNIFYLQHKDESIIRYEEGCFDETYEFQGYLEKGRWQMYDLSRQSSADRLLLIQEDQVAVLDTGNQDVCYHSLPDFFPSSVLGLSENRKTLYWYISSDSSIGTLDLGSGLIKTFGLPLADREVSWWNPIYLDGKILYAAMAWEEGQQNELVVYSWTPPQSAPKALYRRVLAEKDHVLHWGSFLPDPEEHACFLAISGADSPRPSHLLRLDIRSGNVTEISGDFLPETRKDDFQNLGFLADTWHNGGYCWSRDGSLAVVCYEKTAYCVDQQGNLKCQIPLKETVIASRISADGKSVFLVEKDGSITRWRLQDGMWMGSIALKDYCGTDFLSAGFFRWEFREDTGLVVCTDTETLLLDLSGDTLAVRVCVENAHLLDSRDRFWILEDTGTTGPVQIGMFRRYTTEQLRTMARAALQ